MGGTKKVSKKYKRGEPITTLDEYARQELIWDARINKVYHCGWFKSWQFRWVEAGVKYGWFYTVKKFKEQKNG